MFGDGFCAFRALLSSASLGPVNSSSVVDSACTSVTAASTHELKMVLDVWPVVWAILAAMLMITVLTHWRHALGSIPVPAGVPVLPGPLPLLGHCIPALSNLHRSASTALSMLLAASACISLALTA
jgi:hypothetical protein